MKQLPVGSGKMAIGVGENKSAEVALRKTIREGQYRDTGCLQIMDIKVHVIIVV